MDITNFEFDSQDVSARALHVLAQAYINHHGVIPDISPFPKPLVYDNTLEYIDSPLDLIAKAVNVALRQIVEQKHPGYTVYSVRLQPDIFERIAWTVFTRLKLLSIVDDDETYDDFSLDTNYGERQHIDMKHNRILAFEQKSAQEQLDKLQNALMDILDKRYKYLKELFSTQEPQEKERIMAHIERCMQEIHPIKRDIHSLCDQFQLPNQLLPVEMEESFSLSQIVHWNYIQRQETARAEFELSESEKILLPFVPSSFRKTEWPLFHFTFVSPEEIEEHNMGEPDVSREDIRLLRERSLERKMMIGYYIFHQLALHRRKRKILDPQHVALLTRAADKLSIEIDLLRRKLMNKKGKEVGMKYHLSEINGLLTSMQNVLQIPHMSPALSQIMEGVMEVMHAFYSSCNAIYADKHIDPLEIDGLIGNLRLDTLERLRTYEAQIIEAETSSPLGDDADFHRVVDIVSRALTFLEEKK